MLRSAVGKTNVLQSGLVMDYTTSYFPCWDTLWIPNDHMDLCQTPCVQVPVFQFLPTGLHGLCFGYCFSGPLPLRSLTNGPLFRVRFGESLVVRLYSEIDHIHLSIEAQCVIGLLSDCHTNEYLYGPHRDNHWICVGTNLAWSDSTSPKKRELWYLSIHILCCLLKMKILSHHSPSWDSQGKHTNMYMLRENQHHTQVYFSILLPRTIWSLWKCKEFCISFMFRLIPVCMVCDRVMIPMIVLGVWIWKW